MPLNKLQMNNIHIKLNRSNAELFQQLAQLSRNCSYVRFQVLTAASMMFRAVFWVVDSSEQKL
jgi:hypothetical protein